MSYIVTLIAAESHNQPLNDRHVLEAIQIASRYDVVSTCKPVWLKEKKAVDIGVSKKPDDALVMHWRDYFRPYKTDFIYSSVDKRRKKLLIADMDSTIVKGETLDDLAAQVGIGEKIAEITKQAMEGHLDFQTALQERVRLLEGIGIDQLAKVVSSMKLNDGVEIFMRVMRENAKCVLISGGFNVFTEKIAEKCGFHFNHGNKLEVKNDKLTGRVKQPILDKNSKIDFMRQYLSELKLNPAEAIAIGDGANDLLMLKHAGLGIGFHPKKIVAEQIPNCIIHGDMTAALYAQGYQF